jgi:hypothetical protein
MLFSYANLLLPRVNCPPESTRGFLRGFGEGASPLIHDAIGVESKDGASVEASFFFPNPIMAFFSLAQVLSSLFWEASFLW